MKLYKIENNKKSTYSVCDEEMFLKNYTEEDLKEEVPTSRGVEKLYTVTEISNQEFEELSEREGN